MASDDDDFALLGDDAQSHQPPASFSATHRYVTKPAAHSRSHPHPHPHPHPLRNPKKGVGVGVGVIDDVDVDVDQEGYGEAFAPTDDVNHCFADGANLFAPRHHGNDQDGPAADGDDNNNGGAVHPHLLGPPPSRSEPDPNPNPNANANANANADTDPDPSKRKDRDELSDGESPYFNSNSAAKKSRPMPSSSGDYRKDREEWSDSAIGCLLDAYTDKYVQLNRGNLRGRDWEDVATIVSERCDKHKSGKSVEQCKNKVDNLKKRYKVECQRLSSGNLAASHWPWFKKMEQIVGSSSSSTKPATEDDKSPTLGGGSALVMRQIKRYPAASPGSVNLTNNFKMKSLSNPKWKRVVLKISGAALAGSGPQNVDPKVIMLIAREIAMASRVGVEVAVVVGAQNFFCGDAWVAATGTDRATAYQIGMMASAMNGILLQASLEKIGVEARVQTGFMMQEIAEPYVKRRAIRHLEKGRVVVFGGIGAGAGNPFFTSDTAAALRASEIHADAVLKGTNTDAVYECHSRNNAVVFEHISFREWVSRGFNAMDMTAITYCEENNIPVVLFNLFEPGSISRALCGDRVGTLIDQSGRIN